MRLLLLLATLLQAFAAPPGIIIDHSPAESGLYIGSPSIVILPNGRYLASHDFFGPKSEEHQAATSVVFASDDHGQSWHKLTTLKPLFWGGLFVHRDAVYILGTTKHHGQIVIRRSTDSGATWTDPSLLTQSGEYHNAPTPVIEHNGRLWRGFEDASGGTQWGSRYLAIMLSAPIDADLLSPTNWTLSKPLARDPKSQTLFNAWLEGNAVVTPDQKIATILRLDTAGYPEKAAILSISADGKSSTFDPDRDLIDFPGGAKKFTIRHDPKSNTYWTLANLTPKEFQTTAKPATVRNTLALFKSENLRDWQTRAILLQHPDPKKHAFQYPDWQFDGDDIIAAIRTAYDDDHGGAHNAHDANFLTFHRFQNFRALEKLP